jgi:hypothetical protein
MSLGKSLVIVSISADFSDNLDINASSLELVSPYSRTGVVLLIGVTVAPLTPFS